MELFDPSSYFRPIAGVPDEFDDIGNLNHALKHDPSSLFDIIRSHQFAVRMKCESIVSPHWKSMKERAPLDLLSGEKALIKTPLVGVEPMPTDIILPVEFDYEDKMQSDSVALAVSVGLEVIRALGSDSPTHVQDVLRLARAKSLYRSFKALRDMEKLSGIEDDGKMTYYVSPNASGAYVLMNLKDPIASVDLPESNKKL